MLVQPFSFKCPASLLTSSCFMLEEIKSISRMSWCPWHLNQWRSFQFLETYIPRLNHEETENLNRLIITNKIDSVIKKHPTNKSPGPDGLIGEFYQTFKEQLTAILLKLFQKIQEEGRLPSSFYIISIVLTPKPDKDISKRKEKKNIGPDPWWTNMQKSSTKY